MENRLTEHSEADGLAVMRGDAERSLELRLSFANREFETRLTIGKRTIWSGTWHPDVLVDDEPRPLRTDWSETCWYTDPEVDYLEVEARLGPAWVVQRQVLLARKSRLVFTATAVIGEAPAKLEIRHPLPLSSPVRFEAESESREGVLLSGNQRLVRVLPLALPEWRRQPAAGWLEAGSTGLVLRQEARGRRLYAPLLFDLDSRRLRQPLTWRQLTVAEKFAEQPPDVAVGYRVQIGKLQWLCYRSLAPRALRTVLGRHLGDEFLFGQLRPDGIVDELVRVE